MIVRRGGRWTGSTNSDRTSHTRLGASVGASVGRGLLFFFSSRRRHTRLQGDWGSDVCSSDLLAAVSQHERRVRPFEWGEDWLDDKPQGLAQQSLERVSTWVDTVMNDSRSEERRVGNDCKARWSLDW